MKKYYIKYAISPVQEFIEASKTIEDMWASSYLISYIAARVMYRLNTLKLNDNFVNADFVYPKFKGSKFDELLSSKDKKFLKENSMPNLPNTFLASFDAENKNTAKLILEKLNAELSKTLNDISTEVKKYVKRKHSIDEKLFEAQAKVMFSSQYFVMGFEGKGTKYADETESYFAYYKNTRAFNAWNNRSSWDICELGSDSLNGKEEAVIELEKNGEKELMGASSLCKRYFFDAYIRNTYMKKSNEDDKEKEDTSVLNDFKKKFDPFKTTTSDKESYYAMLMLDGDNMGKLLSAEDKNFILKKDKEEQRKFVSNNLTVFSGTEVEPIVTGNDGILIYSGGDDVFAVLPIKNAIKCIRAIRDTFKELFANADFIDVSCGLSIAHKKAYLSHVVRSTRQAEKRAKNDCGRKAVAISLIKRSGEIVEADFKLDSKVLALYEHLLEKITQEKLAMGFSNKLLSVLNNYMPISKEDDSADKDENKYNLDKSNVDEFFDSSNEILKAEFHMALDRDGVLSKLADTDKNIQKKEISEEFKKIFEKEQVAEKEQKKLWREFVSMLQLLAWMDGREK